MNLLRKIASPLRWPLRIFTVILLIDIAIDLLIVHQLIRAFGWLRAQPAARPVTNRLNRLEFRIQQFSPVKTAISAVFLVCVSLPTSIWMAVEWGLGETAAQYFAVAGVKTLMMVIHGWLFKLFHPNLMHYQNYASIYNRIMNFTLKLIAWLRASKVWVKAKRMHRRLRIITHLYRAKYYPSTRKKG
jgi:hypothetical protein